MIQEVREGDKVGKGGRDWGKQKTQDQTKVNVEKELKKAHQPQPQQHTIREKGEPERAHIHQLPLQRTKKGLGSGPSKNRAAPSTITFETSRACLTSTREGAASGVTVAGVFTPILVVRPPQPWQPQGQRRTR